MPATCERRIGMVSISACCHIRGNRHINKFQCLIPPPVNVCIRYRHPFKFILSTNLTLRNNLNLTISSIHHGFVYEPSVGYRFVTVLVGIPKNVPTVETSFAARKDLRG